MTSTIIIPHYLQLCTQNWSITLQLNNLKKLNKRGRKTNYIKINYLPYLGYTRCENPPRGVRLTSKVSTSNCIHPVLTHWSKLKIAYFWVGWALWNLCTQIYNAQIQISIVLSLYLQNMSHLYGLPVHGLMKLGYEARWCQNSQGPFFISTRDSCLKHWRI